jgi:glyoxylate reductase
MSPKPVLLLTRKLPDAVEARAKRDYEVRLNPDDTVYDADTLIAKAAGADAILPCSTEKFTTEVIGRLPASVRILATYSVGYDHIDVQAAKARGLVVTNTPEVLTAATADIAMLLMLGAARRASEGERLVRERRWGAWAPTFMLGTDVTGKRLGILGMGRIGRAVARRARGFEMTIHYCSRRRLPPGLEQGAVYHDDPADLLRNSDIFSLHCPATPETHHFVNAERIALLPDGAIVVNTSRGSVVDDEALIAALKSGKLAAAGLDVFHGEPDIHPGYYDLANTFLLPHMGSATRETRAAMGFRALDNLDAYFARRDAGDRVV